MQKIQFGLIDYESNVDPPISTQSEIILKQIDTYFDRFSVGIERDVHNCRRNLGGVPAHNVKTQYVVDEQVSDDTLARTECRLVQQQLTIVAQDRAVEHATAAAARRVIITIKLNDLESGRCHLFCFIFLPFFF
jgi:hypothetical protein